MAHYYKCSKCGANLDPGEHCDCHLEIPLYRMKLRDMTIHQWKTYKINKALGYYDNVDDINDKIVV